MNTKELTVVTGASKGIGPPCQTYETTQSYRSRRAFPDATHALEEERAMNNFHASTIGGAVGPNFIR